MQRLGRQNGGFGSIQNAAGAWVPYPLIHYAGSAVVVNPFNSATYTLGDDAGITNAVGAYQVTEFVDEADYNAQLAAHGGDVLNLFYGPPIESDPNVGDANDRTPAELHPDVANVILSFYSRYLHREVADVDVEGLNHWITSAFSDTWPNIENAFRVQAVNDGLYTNATLPAWLYPPVGSAGDSIATTIPGGSAGDSSSGTGDGTSGGGDDSTATTTTTGTSFLSSIEEKIGSLFDGLATQTGLSRQTLEIGAVVVGIGALYYFNSQGGTKRR